MKKTTNDWFASAESDLQLIEVILSEENLTHLSAFHAQQAIEKSFKAIIEEYDIGSVKTHSLENLYAKVQHTINLTFNIDILILLDQLYIDARYPGELGLLPNGKPSMLEVKEFNKCAKAIFEEAKVNCS